MDTAATETAPQSNDKLQAEAFRTRLEELLRLYGQHGAPDVDVVVHLAVRRAQRTLTGPALHVPKDSLDAATYLMRLKGQYSRTAGDHETADAMFKHAEALQLLREALS